MTFRGRTSAWRFGYLYTILTSREKKIAVTRNMEGQGRVALLLARREFVRILIEINRVWIVG